MCAGEQSLASENKGRSDREVLARGLARSGAPSARFLPDDKCSP